MTKTAEIALTVNGALRCLTVPTNLVLADLLRDTLHLTGCKVACDQAVCGACTVLVDGEPAIACTTFAFEVDGAAIRTVEGLADATGTLHPVQAAFLATNAFQCGFCTGGIMLSVVALLAAHPDPDEATIRAWLNAHICRCTGYEMIVDAVKRAAASIVKAA